MDTQEFSTFMEEHGFAEYVDLFVRENLTEETVLTSLTSEELAQIGITKLGDRKRMIEVFSKFQPEKPSEPIQIQEPLYTSSQTSQHEEKKGGGGVWVVVGVLLAIVLGIIIIGSL